MLSIAQFLLPLLCVATVVNTAPAKTLDKATLLKNAQEAQQLNVAFQTLKETDTCNDQEKACISNGIAVCVNGKWSTANGACSTSQSCFAVPSVDAPGTNVICTSEKSALSLLESCGASGGIFGQGSSSSSGPSSGSADETPAKSSDKNSTITSTAVSATITATAAKDGYRNTSDGGAHTHCANHSTTDNGTASASATGSASPSRTAVPSISSPPVTVSRGASNASSPDVVTVTVTVGPQPTTLAPQTRTLSPEEAASVLSSLMADGATIILTAPTATRGA